MAANVTFGGKIYRLGALRADMIEKLEIHHYWMDRAIALAREAGISGEIPVGAIVVSREGEAIATGVNRKERDHDPTAHAEIVAIRQAARDLQNWNLTGCTLYVTLEPCPMCTGAILQSRISNLIYGADDPKAGAIRTVANLPDSPLSFHKLKAIAGIRERECQELLQEWFQRLRQEK